MPELILSKHHCFKTSCFNSKTRRFSAKLYVTFLIVKEILILTTFASQKVHTFCGTKMKSFKKNKKEWNMEFPTHSVTEINLQLNLN